jgi:mono/diheme cytochrome c family protein
MRNLFLAGLLVALVGSILTAAPQQAGKQATAAADPNRALVDRYCVGCHNQRLKTAKLELDVLDLSHPEKDALTWERAIRKLRGGMMPPPGAPKPPPAEVNSLATYLEDSLDKAGAANPNPGNVLIHRLNRAEYANAARDLFGIDVDAAALLPTDDISDGFDNISKALKVSPSFLDQYIMAARAVIKKAIGTPPAGKESTFTIKGIDPSVPLPPGARSGITARHSFPYEGDYELRTTGNPAVFTIDGKIIDIKARTHLTAGFHTIVAANPAHSFAENEGALQGFAPGLAGTGYASTGTASSGAGGGGGRGGLGASITVNGPFNPTGNAVDTPSRARIFICRPPDAREETACASRILSNIGRQAFRRPVTDKDLAPLMKFYSQGREAGTFDAGVESALVALLSSSKFLYRIELPPANAKPGSIYQLNGLEMASRLSFFLWSSLPDEELLTAGEQGKLSDPKILEQQVRRMLADSRSKTLTTNFAFEWLKVRDMDRLDPDPYVYPGFDESLRTAFRREMELFIDSVFREDRSVVDLLGADYTFVNERLAAHYGVDNVRGDQFRRVTLTDPNRFGLLGKGAVLMVTAYPNRTSPVLRGAYILENLLGTPPSPPPPNVEAFKENKEGEKPKTIREIMETHRANPTCNACHGVMDPLGFSLENFDTIASYRSMDRFTRTKIDTSGKLVDGTAVNDPSDLRKALMTRPDQFAQTFTEKLMTYALGRGIEAYDMPSVRKIVKDSKRDSNYKFSSIVMGIVKAPAFQSSMVEQPAAAQVAAVTK